MKRREGALRSKRFEATAKVRKVEDLQEMIRDFGLMAEDLERQVTIEEERTGVRDLTHFAYSTFARSALQRRDNLKGSIVELEEQLATAIAERDAALAEFADAETIMQRDEERGRGGAAGAASSLAQR